VEKVGQMRNPMAQVRAKCAFLALALALALTTPAPTRAQNAACAFRLDTVAALFEAAGYAEAAVDALAQGDGTAAAEALGGAGERLLAEKQRVAAGWRGVLDAREKRQLVKALKTARKRASRGARAAERKPPDAVAPLAEAALGSIESALAAQGEARAAAGCEEGGEIHVTELVVGEGRTRTVPAAATLVAELGIEIHGTLAVRGPGGGLTLQTLEGDIVIEGTVDAAGDPPLPDPPSSRAAASRPRAPGARAAADGRPSCGSGRPLTLNAARSISIGPRAVLATTSGRSCGLTPARVTSWEQLEEMATDGTYGGRHGGDGGDIVFNPNYLRLSTTGVVSFDVRPPDAQDALHPGGGGDGESLSIDPALVPPDGIDALHVLAGDGGDSGVARTAGPDVVVQLLPPAPATLYTPDAIGGNGGAVIWDAADGSAMLPLPLNRIHILGGAGGRGIARGGNGGLASYGGDRLADEAPHPTTPVEAIGGAGGGVFVSPGETIERGLAESVTGGRGGDADARGHHGWSGSWAHGDGADGGAVVAIGGRGGDIRATQPALVAARIRGGDGGDASGEAGRGGDGHPGGCELPAGQFPGGDGGDGGRAEVRGGSGGEAPEGHGGNGGSVRRGVAGAPGFPGSGSTAGACGIVSAPELHAGRGGPGAAPGLGGTIDFFLTPPPCAPAAEISCDEVSALPDPCSVPEWYVHAIVQETQTPFHGTSTLIRRRQATRVCRESCRWIGQDSGSLTNFLPGAPPTVSEWHDVIDEVRGMIAGTHCPANARQGDPAHYDSGADVVILGDPGGPPTIISTAHFDTGSHRCGEVHDRICCGTPPTPTFAHGGQCP
jgi:hypothetical protein